MIPEPQLVDFTGSPMPFLEAATTGLQLSTLLVAVVAFMIAASFIGAEYGSGSIANWLTFIPRRGHVFWSKLLTVAGFAALLGASGATLVLARRSRWPTCTVLVSSQSGNSRRWERVVSCPSSCWPSSASVSVC